MFEARMTEYNIQEPYIEDDGYNYEQVKWKDAGTAFVYITHASTTDYQSNDFQLKRNQFIGHTTSELLDTDWLIENKYRVDYVVPARHSRTLYLTMLEGREYE